MALAGLIMGYISLSFILIIAAIAIPNLLRARISANEAAAAEHRAHNQHHADHIFNTAIQSRDMRAIWLRWAVPIARSGTRTEHACLLDSQLGRRTARLASGARKDRYKFTISSNCAPARFGEQQQGTDNACTEYVIAATPIKCECGAPQLLLRI